MPIYSKRYLETALEIRKLNLQPDIEKEILKYIKEHFAICMIQYIEYSIGNDRRKNNIFEKLMAYERNNYSIIANKIVLKLNIFSLNLANLLAFACKCRYNKNDININWRRLLAKIYVGLYYSEDDPEVNIYYYNMHFAIIEKAFLVLIEKIFKFKIDPREKSGYYLYNKKLYNKLIEPFKNSHYIMEW